MMSRYLRKGAFVAAALGAVLAVASSAAAPALAAAGPQRVIVMNKTRFEPLAQDAVIPAGQSARFEVRAGGFGRVSLLMAGTTTPGATPTTPGSPTLALITVYGPPLVPSGPPRPIHVDADGVIRDRMLEPVLGPAMAVVIRNDSSADATLSLSAYFAD